MPLSPRLPAFSRLKHIASLASLLAFSSSVASATPVTFTGEDLNAGPGSTHPNASAAAASFSAAAASLGAVGLITFENAPVGAFSSLGVAPGVTLSGQTYTGGNQAIMNTAAFPSAPSLDGFNTTPGGANYAEIEGGSLVFTFATPTQFFGAYLSGVQTSFYLDTFTFSDGTTQTISVPGAGTSSSVGALDFVGFTDAGKSISSVTVNAGNQSGADFLGVDDVMYQTTATTPEPGSFVLLLSGMIGLGYVQRRRLSHT